MENEFWLNLSSKDLPRAKEFFVKLGFTMNECHQAHHMVSMFIGNKKTVLNLFTEDFFKGLIGGHSITNTSQSNEVLFSIGAGSPKEDISAQVRLDGSTYP